MAVPESVKLDSLIQETETLKFKFEYAIQPHNREAFFKCLFFELSPRELQVLPEFSNFDRKIQFFDLVANCITEVNENIFRLIETDEHVRRYLQGVSVKIEHLHRKIFCFFLGNLSENDKNVRLSDEKITSLFENMAYMNRINLPKDPNAQNPAERQLVGKNIHSGTLNSNLFLTMNYVWTCNHIEVQFEKLRRHVTEQIEKYNPTANQKNEIQKPETNLSKPPNYCISKGQIVDLYDLLESENVIGRINCDDFLNCFDLNRIPTKHPTLTYKKMFVFALSLIDGMSSDIANKNFGVTNYDKNKSDLKTSPIPKNRQVTKNKIASIISQPVKVISK